MSYSFTGNVPTLFERSDDHTRIEKRFHNAGVYSALAWDTVLKAPLSGRRSGKWKGRPLAYSSKTKRSAESLLSVKKAQKEKALDDPLDRLIAHAHDLWGCSAAPPDQPDQPAPCNSGSGPNSAEQSEAITGSGQPMAHNEKPNGHGFSNDNSPKRLSSLNIKSLGPTIFVSYSRRCPAALNATLALVSALRTECAPDGQPYCSAVQSGRVTLWLDKEQMLSAPGENWASVLAQAQKLAVLNCFFLSNAFAGSDECMKELQCKFPVPCCLCLFHRRDNRLRMANCCRR